MTSSKLSLIKVWIYITVIAAGLSSLSSCQKDKKPSILILAIDRLAFNSFSCGDDKQNTLSGLNILCKEAIRFTHAYTTSVQPSAALASLLTGLYPVDHKLHQSSDRLDPNIRTLPEKALALGYHTYFFGGSPTVLRKTGLSAGFDIFDDFSFLEKKIYFMDLKFQSEKFLTAVSEDKNQFFSVIHNSELTSLNQGESEISGFEKLDEKIYNFFNELKIRNLWDGNYVIVVGLQGESDPSRSNETSFSNLNSENTLVTLFLKPPRSMGDEGIFWKIDSTVSLADIGHSLWTTITADKNPNKNNLDHEFPIYDISATWLKQSKSTVLLQRRILIEAIDTWTSGLALRFSVIYKNLKYTEGLKSQVYNILTDGMESINISSQQKQFIDENLFILSTVRIKYNILFWENYQSQWSEWILSNREYWSKPNSRPALFKKELERLKSTGRVQPLTGLLLKSVMSTNSTAQLNNAKLNFMQTQVEKYSEKQQETYFEKAKLQSINLALENIWGLWKPAVDGLYSDLIFENQ